jgi:maltose phosphorylase
VWHHGDLEIHVPAAVAYGIWHYVNVTGDRDFLFQYGVEMLVEISRFYASHGNWSPKTGEFGLWGVMGADEFHMMVHNNAYTNTMAKKTFEWTLKAVKDLEKADPSQWKVVSGKTGLQSSELADWKKMARKMRLNQDPKTGLIEQHDGYFDLPEADVAAIAKGGMSICKTHPYISRSRFNWIKQPDVILLQFFFSGDYTRQEKQINFDTYEPKCAHESSLSPGVHSILAAELGNHQMAFDYVKYASRMDLDDYNGNTDQGLHMTSMAAAWMSLVYGFGGMRSDGRQISFRPNIPAKWNSFSFRVEYRGGLIELKADRRQVTFTLLEGSPVTIEIYGKKIKLGNLPVSLPVPSGQAAKTSRKKRA